METALVPVGVADRALSVEAGELPAIITEANKNAAFAYVEFFGAEIENPHTYRAYRHAVDKFLSWCTDQGHALKTIGPAVIGGYIRKLPGSKPTKKLHLAAIRNFFDKLVVRHAVVLNPALSVRIFTTKRPAPRGKGSVPTMIRMRAPNGPTASKWTASRVST